MKILKNISSLLLFVILASLSCLSASAKPASQQPGVAPAVKKLIERANQGDATAQNELGICYIKGTGIQKNDTAAYKWFSKSAAQKNVNGLLNMAYCLRHGFGIGADSIKSSKLYINAVGLGKDSVLNILDEASKKDIYMARLLAEVYSKGLAGKKRNFSAVKTYLKQAINLGDNDAYYPYAEACMRTRDHVSAQKAYEQAYKNGNKQAAYWYGRYLINGEGSNPNPEKGYKLVYPFALNNQTGAMELVGLCLLEGNGVKKNPTEAIEWLTKAANKGSTESQWQLALSNITGNGTDINMLQAFYWMNREAMHSSENRFKNFMDPRKGAALTHPNYILFLQGLKCLNDSDFSNAQKIAKELKKQKLDKESNILEGLSYLLPANPKANPKKGYKLLSPYFESDPLVLYIVDKLQLQGALKGLDASNLRNVVADLEALSEQNFGPAYSLLGTLYLEGLEGLTQSDQRTIACWKQALALDGLSYENAQTLAQCYEDGIAGLKKDPEMARRLKMQYRADQLPTLMNIIPEYK